MKPKTEPLLTVPAIPIMDCSTLMICNERHVDAIAEALAQSIRLPARVYHLSGLDSFKSAVALAPSLIRIIVHQEMFPFGIQNVLEMLDDLNVMFSHGYVFPKVYLISDDQYLTEKTQARSDFYRGEMMVSRMDELRYAITPGLEKGTAQ